MNINENPAGHAMDYRNSMRGRDILIMTLNERMQDNFVPSAFTPSVDACCLKVVSPGKTQTSAKADLNLF